MDAQLAVMGPAPTAEERNWAMAAHLGALIAVTVPFGHVIGPLVVYLVKGAESPFVAQHARASLNYQLTLSIAAILFAFAAVAVFLAGLFALGSAGALDSREGGDGAIGLLFGGLWAGVMLAFLACFVLSLIFIIQGTVAANAGRPYRYPFAIGFLH